MHALIQLIDSLDGLGPLQMGTRVGPRVVRFHPVEKGDDGDLGLAHLEDKEHQAENGDEQEGDDDGQGASFHITCSLWE
jgi:hypothetical protein